MTADLAAFLLSHLKADKQVARDWQARHPSGAVFDDDLYPDTMTPRRVLADIAAKKKIVGLHRAIPPAYPGAVIGDWPCCEVCSASGEYTGTGKFPCDTLRLLAQPYKGRPGWSDEWSV